MPVFAPHIPEGSELVPHNQLAAHMFNFLTGCQAMQRLQINPTKNHTIHTLLAMTFPPLKSTNNEPTHYVTPKTIGYIHGLICDCITDLPSEACNARALRNETKVLEVLEAQEPAVFRHELFNTLLHFYEEVQSIPGAGGRPKPKSFKRPMLNAPSRAAVVADAGGGESGEAAPAAAAEAAAADPPAADAEVPAVDPSQDPPGSAPGRRGKSAVRASLKNLLFCDLVQCVGWCQHRWQAHRLGPAGAQ
jgi:hypothetical protein